MSGVLLGFALGAFGLGPAQAGVVITAGLAGGACAALLVTVGGDRAGRRRSLVLTGLLTAAGGLVLAASSHLVVLIVAAFLGMANGMGRDRGAALILEQAILPGTAADSDRTRVIAWYHLLQDVGIAVGGLCAGLPALLVLERYGFTGALPLRIAMAVPAVLALAGALCALGLGPSVEPQAPAGARAPVTRETRWILVRVSSLFAIDSIAGGFLTTALLAWFFYQRFGAPVWVVGVLFFFARLLNAVSHLGSAWLAKRVGLVNTMVFTHIPSSLVLLTVPWAPSFPVAAGLFLLREALVEMDVPARQSWLMAVVKPSERTLASGVTHVVRLCGWAVAPAFAGFLAAGTTLGAPLVAGASLKIAYDLLLWRAFRNTRPPEEGGPARA